MHQPRAAVERQSNSLSRMMSVTRVLMPHSMRSGRPRADSSSQKATNFLRFMVGSASAKVRKPTPCSSTGVSISSITFLWSRTR